ncbi:hypothetical protein [Prescottella agglutinans]|uniref:Uncharacterized BrkB/YihY/UPF0761 family membrane protein n=1 Tax=Prescottella agglutinans TaxID=1644129 RepID=A0ABT6MKK8_9NOCA|nr:hypothetical protein [Prescottella agglutinans]MDH6284835.1 uncharacterized BrkB/YihY/UPF0761 family membrane protein [Prescottella agglutinans]
MTTSASGAYEIDALNELHQIRQERTTEKTNAAAMVALFAALLGLAAPAIVFGVMGVREIDRRPYETGGWAAVTAIALGIIEIVVAFFIVLYMFAELPWH